MMGIWIYLFVILVYYSKILDKFIVCNDKLIDV